CPQREGRGTREIQNRNIVMIASTVSNLPVSAKWFALVDDRPVPMPRSSITANLLRTQAAVTAGRFLLRDHNSPLDPVIASDDHLDLREGNVFYTTETKPGRNGAACDASPKL